MQVSKTNCPGLVRKVGYGHNSRVSQTIRIELLASDIGMLFADLPVNIKKKQKRL